MMEKILGILVGGVGWRQGAASWLTEGEANGILIEQSHDVARDIWLGARIHKM